MFKVSCIQVNSSADMEENIRKINELTKKAVGQGAQLITTPENSFLIESPGEKRIFYTMEEHPAVAASARMARENGVWLLIGSVAVVDKDAKSVDDGKTRNRSLLFRPDGSTVAYYDKIHMFDVEVGDGQVYRESARMLSGNKAVVAKTGFCQLGMTICYDVRFPHLYRALAKSGANVIAVPSAFTQKTGEAHWHVLLRARAIENACFIVAPAQTGTHAGGRQTYGHSLIIDPWGRVLADGGVEEGIITADIDLSEVEKVRKNLPSLQHDREFSA